MWGLLTRGVSDLGVGLGVEGRLLAPHDRASEMAARWSSENVVVEFRDSQVSCALLDPSGNGAI